MRHHEVIAMIFLTLLPPSAAGAQCLPAPTTPLPRVARAQEVARQRAWRIAAQMPQSRPALAKLGAPTRTDTFAVQYSDALPDSTFVSYEFRFGANAYGIMQNRAGREWLDAASLTAAEAHWPAALQIGRASPATARRLGRPEAEASAGDSTHRCYQVRAARGGQLYLSYVKDTLRRVTWSLDLP